MRYCKSTTESHPLSLRYPKHLRCINDIIKEEHGTILPFNQEVALNLDKVKEESNETNIKRHKSVDFVFGIKEDNQEFSVLVELKLDCKNPKNLREADLRDKIIDSKTLLFGSGIPIYNEYFFVFNDVFFAKEEFRRVISVKLMSSKGKVVNINELMQNFFV